jgi:hypothetical protein
LLRHILFDVELFKSNDPVDQDNSRKRVLWLLQALTNMNRLYLQQHPNTPLLYKSGVKYIVPEQFENAKLPEVSLVRNYIDKNAPAEVRAAFDMMADMCGAGEHFRDIPQIIANGGGDCDNLASWRVAELCEYGFAAAPYITWRKRPDGGTTYHVIVRHADGSSEDPSLLLGMNYPYRENDRREEERKLGERTGEVLSGNAALITSGHGASTSVFGHATRSTLRKVSRMIKRHR